MYRAFAFLFLVILSACDNATSVCRGVDIRHAERLAVSCYDAGTRCYPQRSKNDERLIQNVNFNAQKECSDTLRLVMVSEVDSGTEFLFRCETTELASELRLTLFSKHVDGFGCSAGVVSFFKKKSAIPIGEATHRTSFGG